MIETYIHISRFHLLKHVTNIKIYPDTLLISMCTFIFFTQKINAVYPTSCSLLEEVCHLIFTQQDMFNKIPSDAMSQLFISKY